MQCQSQLTDASSFVIIRGQLEIEKNLKKPAVLK